MNIKKNVSSNWLFILLYIVFCFSYRIIKFDELLIIVIPSLLLLFFMRNNAKVLSFIIPIFGIYQFWIIEYSYYWISILMLLIFMINGINYFLLKKNRIEFTFIDWTIIALGIIFWIIMFMVKFYSPPNGFSLSEQYKLLILPIVYLFIRMSTVVFFNENINNKLKQ